MKKSLLRNMVLGDFKAAGALPEMVQVGNEITNGMIWPLGKLPPAVNGKTLASFVASGLKAVHDTDAGIKTMIHIDKGGDNAASRAFYDQLINTNGVKDFDIIGLSYYPFWHGTMQQMQANINDLAARYGKDVVIVETAFGYTNENFDDTKNPYDAQAERVGGFRSTVQGQATGLRTVMQSLANVPGGKASACSTGSLTGTRCRVRARSRIRAMSGTTSSWSQRRAAARRSISSSRRRAT